MAFKYVAIFALFAVAAAQNLHYQHGGQHQHQHQHQAPVAAPVYHHQQHAPAHVIAEEPAAAPVYHQHAAAPVLHKIHPHHHHEEHEAPAKYDFDYSVHDTQSGDIKQQHEVRDGDNVHGSYSLVDADGLHRIVEYTADEHNGFQATVRREPITKPLEPIHHKAVVAPAVHHQPQHVHYAPAPIVHHAPAPAAHYQY